MMEGNSVIQLINDMVMNGDLIRNLPIKGEISIADAPGYKTILTDAVITGIITAAATYIGAKIGSKNTVKLYKEQENIRIREEMRLEFYREYKQLYKNFYEDFGKLKGAVIMIKSLADSGQLEYLYISAYGNGSEIKKVYKSRYKKYIDEVNEASKELNKSLSKMFGYIKSNITILKSYDGDLYGVDSRGLDVYRDIVCFRGTVSHIETYNEQIEGLEMGNTVIMSNEKIEKIVANYNKIVDYIIESFEEMHDLSLRIMITNKGLEEEFIGDYFKD